MKTRERDLAQATGVTFQVRWTEENKDGNRLMLQEHHSCEEATCLARRLRRRQRFGQALSGIALVRIADDGEGGAVRSMVHF